jgi:putative ABC transport system permease protein
MSFSSHIKTALIAISRNRLRSFLATLAILIGVSSVIVMLAIGQASQKKLQEIIGEIGTTALYIIPGTVTKGGITQYALISTLTPQDAKAIQHDCPDVSYVSPEDQSVQHVVYGTQNWTTMIQGVGADYFKIGEHKLQSGRLFTPEEVRRGDEVCILGQTVAKNLFGDQNPIGQTIRIKHTPFRVIGVMVPKGEIFGQDEDDMILAPYTTVMERITGDTRLNWITVAARSPQVEKEAEKEIESLIHQRHHIAPWQQDDFFIRSPQQFMKVLIESSAVVEVLLAAAASISLLVGGIGIMNTMISSVVERTREIGIRMAVGARQQDILLQFLVEAVVLSVGGGLMGLLLGLIISLGVDIVLRVPFSISPNAVFIAFLFSALVGIFFGYYPAKRASAMNPIEALRFE